MPWLPIFINRISKILLFVHKEILLWLMSNGATVDRHITTDGTSIFHKKNSIAGDVYNFYT